MPLTLGPDERAVVAVEDRLRAAELAQDRATMEAVIADDFVGHGYAGQAIGKGPYVDVHAEPRAGEGAFTRFDVDRQAVTVIGDVAMVRGTQDVAAHVRIFSRYVSLYRREAGPDGAGWRLFFWQETPIVDAASVPSNRAADAPSATAADAPAYGAPAGAAADGAADGAAGGSARASSGVDANKAVIQRLNAEVINGGKVDLVGELLSPDLNQARTALGATGRMLRPGRGWNASPAQTPPLESFKAATAALRAAFPDWNSRIDEQLGDGDTVLTRYTVTGTHRGDYLGLAPTGRRVEFAETVLARFRAGKVVEFWGLGDELAFATALGLVEATEVTKAQAAAGASGQAP